MIPSCGRISRAEPTVDTGDRLVLARRVYTMTGPPIERGAVALGHGRVIAVGTADEMKSRFKASAERLDLEDQVLLPSFVDAHLHLLEMVRSQAGIDLSGAHTVPEVLALLRGGCALASGWRLGYGLDRHRFPGWQGSAREQLDSACAGSPVVVASQDLHTLWANSVALHTAKMESQSGELKEGASLPLRRAIPVPDGEDWERAFARVTQDLLRHGITRIEDFNGLRIHQRLLSAQTRASLPLKFTTSFQLHELDQALGLGFETGKREGRITCGHLKLFADGSLGSQTAWMLAPFVGTDERGQQSYQTEVLGALVRDAHEHRILVALHAIGTAANRQAAAVLGAGDRIEHAQHVGEGDFSRIARTGCLCCVNPLHLPLDWRAAQRMLPKQGAGSYPFASFARAGVRLAFGSDAPVAPAHPIEAVAWAVCRFGPDAEPQGGFLPEERIDVSLALRATTTEAARAVLAPEEGFIAPGAAADLVALDRDPLEVPPEQIAGIQVNRVWMDGTVVRE